MFAGCSRNKPPHLVESSSGVRQQSGKEWHTTIRGRPRSCTDSLCGDECSGTHADPCWPGCMPEVLHSRAMAPAIYSSQQLHKRPTNVVVLARTVCSRKWPRRWW